MRFLPAALRAALYAVLLPTLAAVTAAQAETAPSHDTPGSNGDRLQPFRAEYRINVSRIPTPIRAELLLEAGDDPDVYRMQMSVDSRLMQNTELSIFHWQDCLPRTQHYMHHFRGFRRERDYFMDFQWDETPPKVMAVSTRDGDEKTEEYEIDESTVDELTMLLTARCLLRDDETEYTLKTAYGTRVRSHQIAIVDREVLPSPLGDVDTLKIEKRRDADSSRYTVFWLAPELDYMLIRARHVESRGLYGELRLTEYEGPLQPLD